METAIITVSLLYCGCLGTNIDKEKSLFQDYASALVQKYAVFVVCVCARERMCVSVCVFFSDLIRLDVFTKSNLISSGWPNENKRKTRR